jgi:hypothetical protein
MNGSEIFAFTLEAVPRLVQGTLMSLKNTGNTVFSTIDKNIYELL